MFLILDLVDVTCECSQDFSTHSGIVGGQNVSSNTYNFHTLIKVVYRGKVKYCSGNLINNLYVLSSAKCVKVRLHNLMFI